jgi:hypothetical protein
MRGSDKWVLVVCLFSTAVGAVIAQAWPSISSESRRRGLLAGIVLGAIGANCVWGGLAVRRANASDRELEDLRNGLARLTGITQWTLVVPVHEGTSAPQPPAALIYALRSLWPTIEMSRVDSWDSLATELDDKVPGNVRDHHLIVTWSPYGRVRPTVPAGLLKAAAPPCLFREHEVAGFFPGDASP